MNQIIIITLIIILIKMVPKTVTNEKYQTRN
jgi:hypothetical protein